MNSENRVHRWGGVGDRSESAIRQRGRGEGEGGLGSRILRPRHIYIYMLVCCILEVTGCV